MRIKFLFLTLFFLCLPVSSFGEIKTISGVLSIPNIPSGHSGSATFSAMLLDAADEKAAVILQCPETGNVSNVHFRTGTVTTGATLDVRLETVSLTDGNPTGTLFGANTNVSHAVADTDDNLWIRSANLTSNASCTMGAVLAVVIVNPSASPGNLEISIFDEMVADGFPYINHFTTLWTKDDKGPVVALEYDNGGFYFANNIYPISSIDVVSYNSASAVDERAGYFQFPFPGRVRGGWAYVDGDADFDVVFYDGANPATSFDVDVRGKSSAGLYYFVFSDKVTLAKDTAYRVSIKPTTANSITLSVLNFFSTGVMQMSDGGTAVSYSERVDSGAWTDVATKRPMMGLFFDGFDDGVAGGGGGVTQGGIKCFEAGTTITYSTHYKLETANGQISTNPTAGSKIARLYDAVDTLVDTVADAEFTQIDAVNYPGLYKFPLDLPAQVGMARLIIDGMINGKTGPKTVTFDVRNTGECKVALDASGYVTVGGYGPGEAPFATSGNPKLVNSMLSTQLFREEHYDIDLLRELQISEEIIIVGFTSNSVFSTDFEAVDSRAYFQNVFYCNDVPIEITGYTPAVDGLGGTIKLDSSQDWSSVLSLGLKCLLIKKR